MATPAPLPCSCGGTTLDSLQFHDASTSPSDKPATLHTTTSTPVPKPTTRQVPRPTEGSDTRVIGAGTTNPAGRADDEVPGPLAATSGQVEDALPTVCPWGAGTLVTVLGYYVCLALVLGVGGLSLSAALLGTTMGEMSVRQKALALLSCQTLEGAGVALVLNNSLQEFAPLPPRWFQYRTPSWGQLASVAGGGVALILACSAAILWTGVEADAARQVAVEQLVSSRDATTELATVAGVCIVTPLLEEVVFRGFLLASLRTMVSPWSALLLSSLAFAICHFNPPEFPMLLLTGTMFGGLYVRSGNLAAPVMAHAAWNGLILFSALWVQEHAAH